MQKKVIAPIDQAVALQQRVIDSGIFPLDIPVEQENGETIHHYYMMNLNDIIGKGSFGKVYKGYAYDVTTGKTSDKPVAVKVIPAEKYNETEYHFFSLYYKAEPAIQIGDKVYMVMEYFPGEDLFKGLKLHDTFKHLAFGTRLELIFQLCVALNSLHHDTVATGSALSHGDIKGNNIRVAIGNKGQVNVYICDFGLIDLLEDKPNATSASTGFKGTHYYAPPEAAGQYIRSTKSDIYALTPIILTLLGATNPFRLKEEIKTLLEKRGCKYLPPLFYITPYDFSNVLTEYHDDLQMIPFDIKHLVTNFLESMQADADLDRPTTDQLLKFFTAFNVCYRLAQQKALQENGYKNAKTHAERKTCMNDIELFRQSIKKHVCIMILLAHQYYQPHLERLIDEPFFQDQIIKNYYDRALNPNRLLTIIKMSESCLSLLGDVKTRLNGSALPESFIKVLEQLSEQNAFEISKILDYIQHYSKDELATLNTVLTQAHQLRITFSLDLVKSICSERFNLYLGVRECVNEFIQQKMDVVDEQRSSFAFWKNYSKGEILLAANKLMSILDGYNEQLSSREQAILNSTELAPMLNEIKLFNLLTANKTAMLPAAN